MSGKASRKKQEGEMAVCQQPAKLDFVNNLGGPLGPLCVGKIRHSFRAVQIDVGGAGMWPRRNVA
ncbi:MAG: hypothetical protein AB7E47_09000 [Desulfovibrionaceae bacterium]